MGKLSAEDITREVELKGCTVVDISGYTNLHSAIKVKCGKGHIFETSLAQMRHPSFECPICNKTDFVNPRQVPQKKKGSYRIVAFDQATEHFGVSVWDDGQLVYYTLYIFRGDMIARLLKIQELVGNIILKEWEPDYVAMEEIQYKDSALMTFKVLSMLLGIIEVECLKAGVPHEVVLPNVWRKYAGTCGKTRKEEKILSVAKVKEKFGISVTDDVAEAILIGSYVVKTHRQMAFGG